jgi:hypothetical protein
LIYLLKIEMILLVIMNLINNEENTHVLYF